MADIISMLNRIRSNAGAEYQATVPIATQANLATVGTMITTYDNNYNLFVSELINRIGFTMVKNKVFTNPLSILKKGSVPMGQDIQEIYTNPDLGGTYDIASTQLLSTFRPDTKVAYYRMNRKGKFSKSISQDNLGQAFTSVQALEQYINSIVNSIYNGDEIEQFELAKQMIAMSYAGGRITEININDDTGLTWAQINALDKPDEYVSKWLLKQIKTYSKLFTYPSIKYNKFKAIKGSGTDVKTWTSKEDQIVILPANVSTNIDVEVLTGAYNMDKVAIDSKILNLDSFIGQPILGMLADQSCFQIYENKLTMRSFQNGDTLMDTYFLHHWQTYGFSLLANCLAFTYTPDTVLLLDGSLGTAGASKITGLSNSTSYKISDNGATATTTTSSATGEITGLNNKHTYFVSAIS